MRRRSEGPGASQRRHRRCGGWVKRGRLPALLAIACVGVVAYWLVQAPQDNRAPPSTLGLPWQIQVHGDGTATVFGVTLGVTRLGEARDHLGARHMELAVLAAPGDRGRAEGYYSAMHLGPLTGRLVLSAALAPQVVEAMKARAVGRSRLATGTLKYTLRAADEARVLRAPVAAITYVPTANLDAALVEQRFGHPAERVQSAPQREHWLYPEKGLDLMLDQDGKEVLQYVAPRDFSRLRRPLLEGRAGSG